jgi:hypothetical protein
MCSYLHKKFLFFFLQKVGVTVGETLAKDLDFLKFRFNKDRFITTAVSTNTKNIDIEEVRNDLDFASTRINISNLFLCFSLSLFP